jgi:hypothetical protein
MRSLAVSYRGLDLRSANVRAVQMQVHDDTGDA